MSGSSVISRNLSFDAYDHEGSSIDMKTLELKSCMAVRSLRESLHQKGIRGDGRRRRRSLSEVDNLCENENDYFPTPRRGSVGFDSVKVREYCRQLGDNPSVSAGPPLTIGWEYNEPPQNAKPLDEYEESRGPTRGKAQFIVSRGDREKILKENGFTKEELASVTKRITAEKQGRKQTINNIKLQWLEEKVERAQRKIKKVVLRKKGTRVLYDEWKKEAEKQSDVEDSDSSCTGSTRSTLSQYSTKEKHQDGNIVRQTKKRSSAKVCPDIINDPLVKQLLPDSSNHVRDLTWFQLLSKKEGSHNL